MVDDEMKMRKETGKGMEKGFKDNESSKRNEP
jgi:hypothetical protein